MKSVFVSRFCAPNHTATSQMLMDSPARGNENEPVVCKPEKALECFLRTRMDVLVIGSFMIRRADNARPA